MTGEARFSWKKTEGGSSGSEPHHHCVVRLATARPTLHLLRVGREFRSVRPAEVLSSLGVDPDLDVRFQVLGDLDDVAGRERGGLGPAGRGIGP